jgi:hypothetical protein
MKNTERKTTAKNEDFLTTVARSIGSTLGSVVAKVDEVTRPAPRRKAGRKLAHRRSTASRTIRRAHTPASKRRIARTRTAAKNRKKSSK